MGWAHLVFLLWALNAFNWIHSCVLKVPWDEQKWFSFKSEALLMLSIFLTGQACRKHETGVKNECGDIKKALPNASKR